MSREQKSPSPHAAMRLEKAQKLAREGEKAWADYEAAGRAADVKIAKLRALRLAKEAAERDAVPAEGAGKPKKTKKR